MGGSPMEASSPARIRLWPAVAVAAVYWAVQFVVAQLDMAMFPRFMSKSLGALAFLLVFLILWLTNGTLTWKVRLPGLLAFIGGIVGGILPAHRELDPISSLMLAVPYVL